MASGGRAMPAPTHKGRREKAAGREACRLRLFDQCSLTRGEGEGGLKEVTVHMDGEGALLQLREAGGNAQS